MLIIYQLMRQKTNIDIPLEVLELIIFFIWKPTEKHLPNDMSEIEEIHDWYWSMEDILTHNFKLFNEYGKNHGNS